MYHARGVVATAQAGSVAHEEFEALVDPPEATVWQENWYDSLTYCKSSDMAQGHDLTRLRYMECFRSEID